MYTGIIGCGVGPVFNNEFKKSTINIIKNSDIIILRDEKSKKNLVDIFKEFNENLNADKIKVSFDPAVECALKFLSIKREFIKSDEILINLRDFPKEYSRDEDNLIINNILEEFIVNVSKKFNNNVIRLIPMHYFHIGDDDRNFLNKIKLKNKLDNVVVQNEVLSLEETMDKFLQAKFCIGMRFHSVVLQTILNGKNLILDYTEPKRGKISGFISDIDDLNFYENRFVSLQEIENIPMEILHDNFEKNRFTYDYDILNIKLDVYNSELSKIKVDKQERIK